MTNDTRATLLALINDCSSLGPGNKTVDYTLYQVRHCCAKNLSDEYLSDLFDRIASVQDGARGPVTEAAVKLLANVRDLELAGMTCRMCGGEDSQCEMCQ